MAHSVKPIGQNEKKKTRKRKKHYEILTCPAFWNNEEILARRKKNMEMIEKDKQKNKQKKKTEVKRMNLFATKQHFL